MRARFASLITPFSATAELAFTVMAATAWRIMLRMSWICWLTSAPACSTTSFAAMPFVLYSSNWSWAPATI